MKSLFIALALAVSLGGCAQTVSTLQSLGSLNVTQTDVDTARSAYDAAFLAPAAAYRQLPLCASGQTTSATTLCAQSAVILKLQSADNQVEAAFTSVQAMVTAGESSGLPAAWSTLQTAVATAENLAATFGVQ